MLSNFTSQTTIPVTDARNRLGKLISKIKDKRSFLLTNRGKPQAVLVDVLLWEDIDKRIQKLYQKTFIDPKLAEYTRDFSDNEIKEWLKEDKL